MLKNNTSQAVEEAAENPEEGQADASLESLLGGVLDAGVPSEDAGETATTEDGQEASAGQDPDVAADEEASAAGEQDDEEDAAPGKQPKWFQKRIDKFTKRLRETEDRERETVGQLRSEIERLKAGQAPQPNTAPAVNAGELSEERLDAEERQAEQVRDAVESYLDDTASTQERAQVEAYMQKNGMDEAGLKRFARNLKQTLERELPKKRRALADYRTKQEAAEPYVAQFVPFMNDPDSAEYAAAQQVLQALPEVKRLPHWKLTAGVYALGLKEFAKLQAASKPGARPAQKTPPIQPGKPIAAAGKPTGKPDGDLARKRFLDTGDAASANEFLTNALRGQGVIK